ncbi:MAG: OmpA family protein [Bacteroidota bacterium]
MLSLKNLICGVLLVAVSTLALSQPIADADPIPVNGKIVDKFSQEPVEGRIHYESLPYGSKIGVFRGNDFSFKLEGSSEYLIKVDAEGYATYYGKVKAEDAQDGVIETIVELAPDGENKLIRLDRLIFALGKDEITEVSHDELDELAAMLEDNPEMVIQLEGHTDFRGNAKQNMRLSERRVGAVRDYLVKKGIKKKRIRTKAFGGTKPLSRSNAEDARRKNRRVEVRILAS